MSSDATPATTNATATVIAPWLKSARFRVGVGELPRRVGDRLRQDLVERMRGRPSGGPLQLARVRDAATHVFEAVAVRLLVRDQLDLRCAPRELDHPLGQRND